jgi:hypothetical protein
MHKLTGNIRYRVLKRFLRAPILVLQVQFTGNVPSCHGGVIDVNKSAWWMDCRPEWQMQEIKYNDRSRSD